MELKKYYKLAFGFLMLGLTSCASKVEEQTIVGSVFGTNYGIKYFSTENHKKSIDSIFQSIDNSLSTYKSTSLISRLNKGEDLEVDNHFKNVFQSADSIYKSTDGYFDPTVGELVNAWGFGSKKGLNNLSPQIVDSLMQFVGYSKLKLEDNRLVKSSPFIYLEFNAIAKGYGLDAISDFLKSKGLENYIIEIGGEVLAKGKNITKEKDWLVGIEIPEENKKDRAQKLKVYLKNRAMASSGNYRKFKVDSLGNKFVHTVNSKTGYTEINRLLSATVFASNCAKADALATSFMAMGKEKSILYLEKHPNLDAIIMYIDSNNKTNIYYTATIKKNIKD